MKTQKLEPSELKELDKHVDKLTNLRSQLAEACLKKEEKIRQATLEYERFSQSVNKENEKISSNLKDLIDEFDTKYGKHNYMPKTGEIINLEPNEPTAK